MSRGRGIPAPPKDLAAAMGEAGRTGDTTRLGLLQAAYEKWLSDQNYLPQSTPRSGRPDKATQ